MVVIFGESGSGKSTVEKMLVAKGLKKIVSITTRQPRAGEVDGVDYHFISYLDFLELRTDEKLAEYTEYDGNYYGIKKEDCILDGIAVVELKGLMQLKQNKGIFILSFYLEASDEIRASFMLARGDVFDRVANRIYLDRRHFHNAKALADHILISRTSEDLVTITDFIIKTIGG